MKKLLGFATMFLLGAGGLSAATPTPNPTLTQAALNIQATETAVAATATYVQTAYPTLTPTLTPTGTLTPSPTFTPAPDSLKDVRRERTYFGPTDFLNSTGNGQATIVEDANALTYFAFPDTGAAMRLQWTVPYNFIGSLKLYAYMNCLALGETAATFNMLVNGQHMAATTQTAGTFNYYWPGGAWAAESSATNVLVGSYGIPGSLFPGVTGENSQVVSRVLLPLTANLRGSVYSLPATLIQAGDVVNFGIVRAAAGTTTIALYGIEAEYNYKAGIPK
jgi:hypothetical protein